MSARYQSFREFYPFYLSEHRNRSCRRLHFVGSSLGLACLVAAIVTRNGWFIPLAFVVGYAMAWAGHVLFEKNRPATFQYPLYSFAGDWAMFTTSLPAASSSNQFSSRGSRFGHHHSHLAILRPGRRTTTAGGRVLGVPVRLQRCRALHGRFARRFARRPSCRDRVSTACASAT
jgi:hypothetical protein